MDLSAPVANDSPHFWLPIRSLNRRSCCGGFGPPRAIEIFHRKIRRTEGESLGFALPPAVLCCLARRMARRAITPSDLLPFL